jgi:hypothetical protein
MPESNIDLILRTKREGDAPKEVLEDLNNVKSGLSNIEKAMAGTRTTIGGLDEDFKVFGTSVGSTADLLDGMGVAIPIDPMMLFGEAIRAGAQYAKDSIADYSAYVEEISKLASFTGMATEETSRLYQAADDLRIPINSLKMALKTMADQGTTPSIEGLMQLSDQYLAIQDPLQQAQFLIDNFGRSGQEMARMMKMGSASIREMTSEIEEWMIVTGKSEAQVNEYLSTMDRWEETLQSVKFEFAMNVIPVVTNFMDAILDANEEVENSRTGFVRYLGILGAVQQAFLVLKNLFNNFRAPSLPDAGGYAGARASGGDVMAGNTYKVGEREVEYLTMGFSGMVTPSSGTGNGTIIFNYSPTVSLADQVEAERKLKPFIQAALRGS